MAKSMMISLFLAASTILGAVSCTTPEAAEIQNKPPPEQPAQSQQACAPRDVLLSAFASRLGETPVSRGLTADGFLLEVLATEDGGQWTIIITSPQGISCVVSIGEAWQSQNVPLDPAV